MTYSLLFKFSRALYIGVGVALAVLWIPLPQLSPTFVPQPRMAVSTVFLQLKVAGEDAGHLFSDLLALYKKYQGSSDRCHVMDPTLAATFAARLKHLFLTVQQCRYVHELI